MKRVLLFILLIAVITACKNNGIGTTSEKSNEEKAETTTIPSKDMIIGAKRKLVKPDFQVLNMAVENNLLQVVFQYSGGCEEHDFNAHFNGGWVKTLPPQAILDFEHLNPNNDACRSVVKDTVFYNLDALKYPGGNEVMIKCTANKKLSVTYTY